MLDCPATTHTSPTRMLLSVTVFVAPLIVITCGFAFAGCAGSWTFQARFWSAVALALRPANVTVTCSPGSAQPHTGTGLPRCTTMFDWNTLLTHSPSPTAGTSTRSSPRTSSCACVGNASRAANSRAVSRR